MKVKEFIKHLKELNQEALVVMSSDAEGNNFRLFSSLDRDSNFDKDENDVNIDGEPCVILFPED